MLLEKLKTSASFTRHERDIASYILMNIEKIPNMTSEELAKASFTSKATVVRLCQKLGLSGYQEFKLKLVAEMNQSDRINKLLENEPITDKSTSLEISQILPVIYDKGITNTRLSLGDETLARIAKVLKEVERIEIYGTGISYTLAQAAAYKFATLGIDSFALESINGHSLSARKKKKSVACLLSFTGANRSITQMAQYLSEGTDSYIIGIAGPHNEQLADWCDEIIEIPNRDSLLSLDVIHSFSATNYVLDILFGILLSLHYQDHVTSSLEMLKYTPILLNQRYGEPTE